MDPLPSTLVLIAVTLACACVEISSKALLSQNQNSIKKLFDEDDEKFKKLSLALEKSQEYATRSEIASLFLMLAASFVAAYSFGLDFSELKLFATLEKTLANALSFTIVFLISTALLSVFAKAVPAKIAKKHSSRLCLAWLPFLKLITAIFAPLSIVVDTIASLLARLFGVKPEDATDDVTEDEIRQMIDDGLESGSIEESETEMIHSIFELDDRVVGEILTHRTDITAVEQSATLDEVVLAIKEGGFSRIPVYKDSLDDVIGILYVKDLIRLLENRAFQGDEANSFSLSDYMRKSIYVPESKSLKELFEEFKNQRIQMAVVVDEYGGTLGIVTMEDIIESIMGSINDEFDEETDEESDEGITKISENEYIIKGLTSVEEVERELGVSFENEEDCDTIGGLVVSMLGIIPNADEHPEITINNLTVKVLSVIEHHIKELHVVVCEDGQDEKNSDDDENGN